MERLGEGAVASEFLFISEAEEFRHDAGGREEEQRKERQKVEVGTDETTGSSWLRGQERGAGGSGGRKAQANRKGQCGFAKCSLCRVRDNTLPRFGMDFCGNQ